MIPEKIRRRMPIELKEGLEKKMSGQIDQYELDKICCYWTDKNETWNYKPKPTLLLSINKINEAIETLSQKRVTNEYDKLKKKENLEMLQKDLKFENEKYQDNISKLRSQMASDYFFILRMCKVFAFEKDNARYCKYDDLRKKFEWKIASQYNGGRDLIDVMKHQFEQENEYLYKKLEAWIPTN